MLLIAACYARGWGERVVHRQPERSIQPLAVLPLENLSHDREQEYFADGITDELITALFERTIQGIEEAPVGNCAGIACGCGRGRKVLRNHDRVRLPS